MGLSIPARGIASVCARDSGTNSANSNWRSAPRTASAAHCCPKSNTSTAARMTAPCDGKRVKINKAVAQRHSQWLRVVIP